MGEVYVPSNVKIFANGMIFRTRNGVYRDLYVLIRSHGSDLTSELNKIYVQRWRHTKVRACNDDDDNDADKVESPSLTISKVAAVWTPWGEKYPKQKQSVRRNKKSQRHCNVYLCSSRTNMRRTRPGKTENKASIQVRRQSSILHGNDRRDKRGLTMRGPFVVL